MTLLAPPISPLARRRLSRIGTGVLVILGIGATLADTQPRVLHPQIRSELEALEATLEPAHETTVVVFDVAFTTSEPLLLEWWETSLVVNINGGFAGGFGGTEAEGPRSTILASLRRAGEPAPMLDEVRRARPDGDGATQLLDEAGKGSLRAPLGAGCGETCARTERFELRFSALEPIEVPQTFPFTAAASLIYAREDETNAPPDDRITLTIVEVRTEGGPPPAPSGGEPDAGIPVDAGASDAGGGE